MEPQNDPTTIRWRIHLTSPPERVYHMLSTEKGRAQFWAESTTQTGKSITFHFPNGETWQGDILAQGAPRLFQVSYYGGSVATFELAGDGAGGTDLTLVDRGVPGEHRCEVMAGWVSVLMALKAAVDHGVDLRNHDPVRTWSQGYADN
ncbi:MAG: SRPBCC domain-containing protein [Anaerolineae bacterium]|jgi:uncharacterized protein YndB with AHSA1/START domain